MFVLKKLRFRKFGLVVELPGSVMVRALVLRLKRSRVESRPFRFEVGHVVHTRVPRVGITITESEVGSHRVATTYDYGIIR